jgi:predicted O-linked N-acetylglucosamine transferase (SPINDLY family)
MTARPDSAAILAWATERLAKGPDAEARAALAEATARFPDDARLAARHADALQLEGALADAAAEYRRALARDDSLVDAWYGLGCAELERRAYGGAAEALARTLALRPDAAGARFNLAKARFELGEVDAALDGYFDVVKLPDAALRREAIAAIACIIPGAPQADNAAILAARRAWAAAESPGPLPRPARRKRAPGDKLRIGYVSAFFGDRNWMKPVAGAVNHHDRDRFELHFFSDGQPPDAQAGWRDFPTDYVHDVHGAANDALAGYVARFAIDVLVDLNAYSYQRRLGLYMRRPAPAIATWFNSYATTGIDAFDVAIGDRAAVPAAEERFFTERVVHVPGSYLTFSVLYPVPDVAPPPALAGGRITFGCFCSQYKMTDATLDAFAAILRGAPEAQLLIKNRTLGDASCRASLHERFARRGIAGTRVLLEGPAEHSALLAAYARVDIALDTIPYSAGTTAMEALWQGVPVLTFNGDRWAMRTARSLLLASGLDAWCLADRDAFVARAIALAHAPDTPAMLASLRAGMRDMLRRSPACDSAALCRALEGIYEKLASQDL